MTKQNSVDKKKPVYRIYFQYVLVGAALGLYYGIFSKPSADNPDYGMVVLFSVLAALVTTIARNWKIKKTFKAIALDFLKIWGMFFLFLLALQLNSVIFRIGGRTAVIVFMSVIGIILGLLMAVRKKEI